jgi:hypothetical protein
LGGDSQRSGNLRDHLTLLAGQENLAAPNAEGIFSFELILEVLDVLFCEGPNFDFNAHDSR